MSSLSVVAKLIESSGERVEQWLRYNGFCFICYGSSCDAKREDSVMGGPLPRP